MAPLFSGSPPRSALDRQESDLLQCKHTTIGSAAIRRLGLDLRTVIVLFQNDRLLLLKRAPWKMLFPGRWTGLGGKVEPGELTDLAAAARRELFEETDLSPAEVCDLRLLRILSFHHPEEGLVCLLYFCGRATTGRQPSCTEGSLAWVDPANLAQLDLIDNTAQVLPLLIDDVRRGDQQIRWGIALYDQTGRLERVVFEERAPPAPGGA